MEYSTDTAFTSPNPCTDTETTGLAEGTYYVRYKATATTEASNYVAVHVRLNTVTVVDGNGTTVTKHKSGTKRQPGGFDCGAVGVEKRPRLPPKIKQNNRESGCFFGVPGGSRTLDTRRRRPVLYPTELRIRL